MALVLNVADTLRVELIVRLQVVPDAESHPFHPANVEPEVAVAVNETAVPEASDALHVDPQLMPFPVTVPEPVPLLLTVSV
jgi:hypothetical protein